MKRFLAAVGILLIIIGISIYTLVDMQQSIDRLTEHTAAVRQQVEKEGAATAQRQCEELMERHGAQVFAVCAARPSG